MNGNLPSNIHVEDLDKEIISKSMHVEIIENDRPLTPDNANNEVFEEITQQLNQLHSTPKPFKDTNFNTPPPSPAEFTFEKEPPNFMRNDQQSPNENETTNQHIEGM